MKKPVSDVYIRVKITKHTEVQKTSIFHINKVGWGLGGILNKREEIKRNYIISKY